MCIRLCLIQSVLLIPFFAWGEVSTSAPATSQPARGPVYQVDQPVYKLQNVWAGDKVRHVFTIRNAGTAPLEITNIEAACGCFVAEGYPRTLPPGQNGEIAVSLQTARGSTEVHKEMQVETNDPGHPHGQLVIEGKLTPRIAVDPVVGANWGRLYPGADAKKVVKLTNHFSRPMKLQIDPKSVVTDYNVALKEIEPGQRAELIVTVKENLPEGSHMQFLNLKTGFEEEPELVVPCTLYVPPEFEVTPIAFSVYDKTGDIDRQTLQLRWNGKSPMRILGVRASDPGVETELKESQAGRVYTLMVAMPTKYTIATGMVEIAVTTNLSERPNFKIPLQPRTLRNAPLASEPY
jgi:Protein of unknown function (DUF1573)